MQHAARTAEDDAAWRIADSAVRAVGSFYSEKNNLGTLQPDSPVMLQEWHWQLSRLVARLEGDDLGDWPGPAVAAIE
jgi:hypothetical protein